MSPSEAYTVEKKDEIRKLNKAGDIETWYRIFATSKGGTYFHVEVKEDNLAQAPAILAKRAQEIDSI